MAAIAYLQHINDPRDCHELFNDVTTVGRNEDSDIILPDRSVSNKVFPSRTTFTRLHRSGPRGAHVDVPQAT